MIQDLQFAARMLVKDKWFTLVAVLALGLGIGLNATVFTFVNAVLIRGLPFHHPEQIFYMSGRTLSNNNQSAISWLDFEELRGRTRTFAGLAAYRGGNFTVTESGHPPERIQGVFVTANTFGLLGQQPLLGRTFVPGEDKPDAAPVALMGYGVWQSRYAGDPGLVGRTIKVNDTVCTIVGIMPEGMKFPNGADLWRPLVASGDDLARRDNRSLNVFGRLAAGATRRQADAELNGIAKQLEQQYPETNKDRVVAVMTFNERFNGGSIRAVFLALLGAVGFVLLIACANVANLLLARSATRTREIAVRFALGASRLRIVRQLLVESILLACLGGIFGLALAHVSVRLFDAAVANVGKPYWIVFKFDPLVFAYFAAICLTTGIIFGLAPALQVSKTNVNEVLKEGGRGSSGAIRARRLVSTMVVAELALTLVLLVGAGLMIRSFLKMYSFNLGVETANMLTIRVQLPGQKYATPEQRRIFYDSLMSRLQAIPGMQAATIATAVPFGGSESRGMDIDGRPVAQTGGRAADGARDGRRRLHGRDGPDRPPRTEPARHRRRARLRERHGQRTLRHAAFSKRGGHREAHQARDRRRSWPQAHARTVADDRRRDADDPAGESAECRTGRRRLSAVPHGIARVHEHHHQEPGPGRDGDLTRSRGGPGRRSGSARLRRPDDGRVPRTGTLAVSRVWHDVHDLRVHRARAVGGGNLRRHGLLGHAANRGDRRAHGARGAGSRSVVADPPARLGAAGHRPDARRRARLVRERRAADAWWSRSRRAIR